MRHYTRHDTLLHSSGGNRVYNSACYVQSCFTPNFQPPNTFYFVINLTYSVSLRNTDNMLSRSPYFLFYRSKISNTISHHAILWICCPFFSLYCTHAVYRSALLLLSSYIILQLALCLLYFLPIKCSMNSNSKTQHFKIRLHILIIINIVYIEEICNIFFA